MIRYLLTDVNAEQPGRGFGRTTQPWVIHITVEVEGNTSLGEIMTDLEQRLGGTTP